MKFKVISTLIAVFIPSLIFSSTAYASNHIDEQQKIWEDNFIQCVNQKQDISIVVSVDTSGSMKENPGEWLGSDNDGFRWEAINALFYQLQQVAQSQESRLNLKINAVPFATDIKPIEKVSSWNDLAKSNYTLEELKTYKDSFNDAKGATDFISAAKDADFRFSSAGNNTCKLWVFITDGVPSKNGPQDPEEIMKATQLLKNDEVFMYGINLFNPGDGDDKRNKSISDMETYLGVKSSNDNKALVVKADEPSALVVLISQLAARSAGNQPDVETTLICQENQKNQEDCYYEATMRPGLKKLDLTIVVKNGKNNGDICLEIVTPSPMNIESEEYCNDFLDKSFDNNMATFTWISDYVATLSIIFDDKSTKWYGLWRFALKAPNPEERESEWIATPDSELIPYFQENINLQYEIKKCIEITYNIENPLIKDDGVKFKIKDEFRERTLATDTGEKTNRGHQVCLTPKKDELPDKIYIVTEIKYEELKGQFKDATVITSELIKIKPEPTQTSFECTNRIGQIKVTNSEVFECIATGGTNDAEITFKLDNPSMSEPKVNWSYKVGDQQYTRFSDDLTTVFKLRAEETLEISILAQPLEASDVKNKYNIKVSSQIVANRSLEKVVYDSSLTLEFVNPSIAQKIIYSLIFFLILLLISLLPSIIYSRLKNLLTYPQNPDLRGQELIFTIEGDEVTWKNIKLFSNINNSKDLNLKTLNYTETDRINLSKREIDIFGDTIRTRNQLFPVFKKPITELISKYPLFTDSIGFEKQSKNLGSSSIEYLWYLRKKEQNLSLIICFSNDEILYEIILEVKQILSSQKTLLAQQNLLTKDEETVKEDKTVDANKEPEVTDTKLEIDGLPIQPDDGPPIQPDDGPPIQPDDGPPIQPDDGPPIQPDD